VDHLQGFVDNEANRQWQNGPDLIESEIVGPEIRLQTFTNRNGNGSLYETEFGAIVPGEYAFDITVAYTPFPEAETAGKAEADWPFVYARNLVLAANEVRSNSVCLSLCLFVGRGVVPVTRAIDTHIYAHTQTWTATEVSLAELEKDKQQAASRALADGRWIKVNGTDGYPHARSEMYTPAEREGAPPAYRCNHVGEYAWTPQAKQESSSWERFGTQEQIYECLRSAKVRRGGGRCFMYASSLCRLLIILT